MAVDALGDLLALRVTPANAQDRAQVEQLAAAVLAATGDTVELAYVDADYTGDVSVAAAQAHEMQLSVVKLPAAERGFVLLRRWVVEHDFAWVACFRRLARDHERLDMMLTGYHFLAFSCLMLSHFIHVMSSH